MVEHQDSPHDAFMGWAIEQGVQVNKTRPAVSRGQGTGIVATASIEAGALLVAVPASILITETSVPRHIKEALGGISVHGLLAATLALECEHTRPKWKEWRATWPSRRDFDALPLTWAPSLQRLVPPTASELLKTQQRKFQKDYNAVTEAFTRVSMDDYMYFWLIVNTRCFYYVAPGLEKRPSRDDCMALCPYLDLLNHGVTGCPVSYGPHGFSVTSDKDYEVGQQIRVSYGNHSNDFLLVEYGFVLSDNPWDELHLDHVLLPRLSQAQKDQLSASGFLGTYVLDRQRACHRTQVGLRSVLLSEKEWDRFVRGTDDGEREQKRVDLLLDTLLETFLEQARESCRMLSHIEGDEARRELLGNRWMQIIELLGWSRKNKRTSSR